MHLAQYVSRKRIRMHYIIIYTSDMVTSPLQRLAIDTTDQAKAMIIMIAIIMNKIIVQH